MPRRRKNKDKPKSNKTYTLNFCYVDENGREKWSQWNNLLYENAGSWAGSMKSLLTFYPGFKYGNLYHDQSRDYVKRIWRRDL